MSDKKLTPDEIAESLSNLIGDVNDLEKRVVDVEDGNRAMWSMGISGDNPPAPEEQGSIERLYEYINSHTHQSNGSATFPDISTPEQSDTAPEEQGSFVCDTCGSIGDCADGLFGASISRNRYMRWASMGIDTKAIRAVFESMLMGFKGVEV
jgi:hypothetical protein